jgi:predicted metal-binding membrane protein
MNALTVIIESETAHVSRRRFLATAALVFIASVSATYAMHRSMSSMGELPMPGGWTLSPAFTPMCGRTWLRAALAFIGMWIAMMTAMMLPSFAPLLWRHRAGTRASCSMAAGYAFVWTMIGVVAFAFGALFTEIVMRAPAIAHCIPFASGAVVLLAGALQCSTWHARRLAYCRKTSHRDNMRDAWLDGVHHGMHCVACCASLTATLFVFGAMDPRVMTLVALAITAERSMPSFKSIPQVIGITMLLLVPMAIVR